MTNQPTILLETRRNNITDSCYYGSYYLAKDNKIIKSEGYNQNTIMYLRSLAKPLQASILCDSNIIKDLKLTQKELAIFQGSHTGSPLHIGLLKKILKKHKIKISDLELVPQVPLDTRGFNNHKTKLHNNCSGKHLMMLIASKYLGYYLKNYTDENHPIQKIIFNKQKELSNYKSKYLTYDGCSTPLWGLPVKNIIEGYYNFFNQEKYNPLICAVHKNPYIFGGFNRLDTEIIQLSKSKLYSKVGAGGFVLVYNKEKNEILVLKMTQNNNEARRLVLLDMLNKLNWLNLETAVYELNQKKQKTAKYFFKFKI